MQQNYQSLFTLDFLKHFFRNNTAFCFLILSSLTTTAQDTSNQIFIAPETQATGLADVYSKPLDTTNPCLQTAVYITQGTVVFNQDPWNTTLLVVEKTATPLQDIAKSLRTKTSQTTPTAQLTALTGGIPSSGYAFLEDRLTGCISSNNSKVPCSNSIFIKKTALVFVSTITAKTKSSTFYTQTAPKDKYNRYFSLPPPFC
jgi:hypothetical protein